MTRLGWRHTLAATRGGVDPRDHDWSGPTALWLTGETGALPDLGVAHASVTIPLDARVESLNVAVAAAVLVWRESQQHRTTEATIQNSKP